ncbi:hypothetical protein [Microbacterium gubbeenense]|uniref:hypothetical protein n=1 Tax=Microbacterium gubbeenense TaxID=159896 RepID=UPI001B7FE769|nr:hypothetical protein [Microbacterium gubbeenense]
MQDVLRHIPRVPERVNEIGVFVTWGVEQRGVMSRISDLLEPVVEHLDRSHEQARPGRERVEVAGSGGLVVVITRCDLCVSHRGAE